MPRYFIEVAYHGLRYSGFQAQLNANTVQAEVEKSLLIFYKEPFVLTGSSRTDTGVHALQNYFHADTNCKIDPKDIYHLNAILPCDIVIKRIFRVPVTAHCRFDAISRTYRYVIYDFKDPFIEDRGYFFPYVLNVDKMQQAAKLLLGYTDFTTFSKRHTQVKNFICTLQESGWIREENKFIYQVTGNRFLRGMVRGLVGTMLKVGTGRLTVEEFGFIIESKDCSQADFSVPGKGLMLMKVNYPDSIHLR